MKVGDLVKDYHPTRSHMDKVGVILGPSVHPDLRRSVLNKAFRVLWANGTIGNNVWDYDLKVVNESR